MHLRGSNPLLLHMLAVQAVICCLLALAIWLLTANIANSFYSLLGGGISLLGNQLVGIIALQPIKLGFERHYVKKFARAQLFRLVCSASLITVSIVTINADPIFVVSGFVLVQSLSWLFIFSGKKRRRSHFN